MGVRLFHQHGHPAGDRLLKGLVSGWRGILRDTDLLARIGGEEFLILFTDANADQAAQVVERLRTLVPEDQTVSAGLATHQTGESRDQLIARADQALYSAKRTGWNRLVIA